MTGDATPAPALPDLAPDQEHGPGRPLLGIRHFDEPFLLTVSLSQASVRASSADRRLPRRPALGATRSAAQGAAGRAELNAAYTHCLAISRGPRRGTRRPAATGSPSATSAAASPRTTAASSALPSGSPTTSRSGLGLARG